MPGVKHVDQLAASQPSGQDHAGGDANGAGKPVVARVKRTLESQCRRLDLFGGGQQILSHRGQPVCAIMPHHQPPAKPAFEFGDATLHGRLVDAKRLGRPEHAARARECQEILQVVPRKHDPACNLASAFRNLAAARNALSPSYSCGDNCRRRRGNTRMTTASAVIERAPEHVEALLKAAGDLAPKIDAVRDVIERERALPAGLVDAMRAAGLFALWLSKTLGGPELSAVDYIRVIEAVARADGSAGWCASIASAYSCMAGFLKPDVAQQIYDGGRGIVAGAVAPTGKALIDDGAFRVTGHWTYGSGILHSTWTLANCVVHDRTGARRGPAGAPEMRLVFFPTGSAEVIDTWKVAGLRGTGSHDYRVAGLFVPADHTISFPAPTALETGLLYRTPLLSGLAVAAVPLGIARTAIDAVIALASAKTPAGSASLMRDKPTVQADVARAEVLLGAARSYLLTTLGELWEEVASGAGASVHQRSMVRLAGTFAAQASAEAVDLMVNAAGGTALFETNPLERCFRDVHACKQHIATSTSNYEMGGRVLLGLEPGPWRF